MDYLRSSIKVAVLFLISCAVLAYFVLHAGQVRLMGETQEFKLLFSSLGNLKLDSPVTYSGYKVGQVIDIRTLSVEERRKHKKDIEVSVRLSKDVTVRQDSKAEIRSLGFLGEKYIEVSPGGFDSPAIPAGSTLEGTTPQDVSDVLDRLGKELDEMIPVIKDTLQKVHSTVERVDKVVQEVADDKKIQSILDQARDLTKRMNHILKENRKNIHQTLSNVQEFSGDLKDQFKQASPKIQLLLDHMDQAVQEMDQLLVEAKGLVHTNAPGIERIMKNLEETSEHAKAFMKILRNEPWRLLSKPRSAPVKPEPKRGYSIYKKAGPTA